MGQMDRYYFDIYSIKKKYVHIIVALLCAYIVASFPLMGFVDRAAYLSYARYSEDIAKNYLSRGLWIALFNEPLWLVINAGFGRILQPETTVWIIVFLPAFTVSYICFKENEGWNWLVLVALLLLFPLVIKNHLAHLRQGFAISIFLLGWYSVDYRVKISLIVGAALIHSSFIFLIVLLIMGHVLRRVSVSYTVKIIIAVVCCLVISFLVQHIADLAGARQADRYSVGGKENSSGLGLLFWSFIMILYVRQGVAFVEDYKFEFTLLLFYLTTYFFSEVSARILESGVLLVMFACMRFKPKERTLFYYAVGFYSIFFWFVKGFFGSLVYYDGWYL